jgi:chemotaxis protein CheY-P-specific phosphatase CheC
MIELTDQIAGAEFAPPIIKNIDKIFRSAFNQAAASASILVNKSMKIDQVKIKIKSGESFMADVEGEFEICYFASIIKTMNNMDFNILFLISEKEGIGLYNKLTGQEDFVPAVITADMIATVGELNNILGSSFINSLANILETVIHATPPYNTFDMLGAVMECIILQDEFLNNDFLCADATIREENHDGFMVRLIIMSNKEQFLNLATKL